MYVNAAEPGGACPGPCWCSMYASLALFPNHHSLLILPRPSDRNPTEKTSRPEETADTLGFGPSSINVTIPSIGCSVFEKRPQTGLEPGRPGISFTSPSDNLIR